MNLLIFALLVANWPFCINEFDLIYFKLRTTGATSGGLQVAMHRCFVFSSFIL